MMMKCLFLLIFCLIKYINCYDGFQSTLGHIKPQTDAQTQTQAVLDLIKRIIPERASEFLVNVDEDLAIEGRDSFTVQKQNGIVVITGSTGVAAASGFNHYLKYYCNAHISWEANQLNLPELPDVDIKITLNDRFRYYQNVCTASYSFVWWDWTQWEKHIDWMALNSFNLVLAFNGEEAIWERVYTKLNLTEQDINEHFTGPAFLAWLRMGNIRGWGGPLSRSWHDRSIYLQKTNSATDEEFWNNSSIACLCRIYPNVNMTQMTVWNDFNDTYCCPYFLDPTEELFSTIGKLFIEEQTAEFGTDHVYNCDSFNEVDPHTSDLTYLSNVGKSIYGAMTAADPEAIWVMQGWLFYSSIFWIVSERVESFITSVPLGKMIILDLQSEQFPQYDRLQQYFGQPYIWCMLHDFGGTLGVFGSVNKINENVLKARSENGSTMIGTGLTPEGINQNYVIYDLMIESAWRTSPSNLTEWFRNYTIRRYGKTDEYTWYEYADLFDAWDRFILAADNLKSSPAFLHDLVDITRQVLQVNGDIYYNKLISAFKDKNSDEFNDVAEIFKNIFFDLESILSTSKDFLLGSWLESAKACANNTEEEQLYEYNARNQITLWGPKGEIMNYANKQWAGVVSDFFYPRWELFIKRMNDSIQNETSFNQTAVKKEMFTTVEEPFTFDRTVFPTEPTGDTVDIAKDIHSRWYFVKSVSRTERSTEDNAEEIYSYQNYVKKDPNVVLIE
ncbi:hypothetical protein NQ317_011809 [Molorchus minor]|uniref:Alpha-N-acetylglucosaminidase n=1 Tax=Molorchus minor TaxID=1323400 RepID=A0ABQ9JEA9_9CUCU|nr:hypothetical protein NQ317_011809 [Molorchus minor]